MSTVLVVTPILIASWPAITAAVTAAVGTLGFAAVQEMNSLDAQSDTVNREEIDVEDSEILQAAAGTEQRMVVERDGIRAVFSRDARGALRICMEGKGVSKAKLRSLGEELVGRVTQQYAYHRIMTELEERHMTVVGEEISEDQTVKIRVRNW